ncbi:hypothetical protein cpL1_0633 [Chlamydia pecorum]|uniref:Uncharacterized protein n=1 Tax=Chlamydia pecorum TaxID=85991 RepID=A0AA40PQ56_9CHLA|nr:hypothetical protein [Chlamydia pecorum]KTF28598.1 hypothetical protein cpL1_0633 [Chlamydia pecorum]KZN26621.1 hypothetical protein cpL17_0760 [Chlamydia pecorum]
MGSQLNLQEYGRVFPNPNFDLQLKLFICACQDKSLRQSVLKYFRYHPLLKAHDIARAVYLLIALEEGQDLGLGFLKLSQDLSGAVKLFSHGGFPWGGLPYPAEHAELGLLLLQVAEFYHESLSNAEKMSAFHQAMFTHEHGIFPSLWSQENTRSSLEKTSLSKSFLYRLDQQVLPEYTFSDPNLGFWMMRTHSSSAYVSASGCKSSVCSYCWGDVGIIACGPSYGEISDCQGFGLCGVAKEFSCVVHNVSSEFSFLNSIAVPYPRLTGFSYLQDAYLGVKVRHQINVSEKQCQVRSFIQEPSERISFSVFCRAKHCQVVNGPKLRSNSLDSYKGPTNDVLLVGDQGAIRVLSAAPRMEIFSLQGEESFWGGNFLINIPYRDSEVLLVFEKKYSL